MPVSAPVYALHLQGLLEKQKQPLKIDLESSNCFSNCGSGLARGEISSSLKALDMFSETLRGSLFL